MRPDRAGSETCSKSIKDVGHRHAELCCQPDRAHAGRGPRPTTASDTRASDSREVAWSRSRLTTSPVRARLIVSRTADQVPQLGSKRRHMDLADGPATCSAGPSGRASSMTMLALCGDVRGRLRKLLLPSATGVGALSDRGVAPGS